MDKKFKNEKCKFYPCHDAKEINCIFCYCPLYNLNCGGKFTILQNGFKDCSNCILPHIEDAHKWIIKKLEYLLGK